MDVTVTYIFESCIVFTDTCVSVKFEKFEDRKMEKLRGAVILVYHHCILKKSTFMNLGMHEHILSDPLW